MRGLPRAAAAAARGGPALLCSSHPIGSTDSRLDRVATHRRRRGASSRVLDPGAEVAYVALPPGPANAGAKSRETAVIRALVAVGFPLLSATRRAAAARGATPRRGLRA